MISLANHEECTGCGACEYICPRRCITMEEDSVGVVYPKIDDSHCVECGSCQNVCPILKPISQSAPHKAYAAWSSDEEERRTSASGGVVAEVYKKALSENKWVVGAKSNEDFSVSLDVTNDPSETRAFKNSKYVFSSAREMYGRLKTVLASGAEVVVVALPCQIAAIRKIFHDNVHLTLIDLICHGTAPYTYLKQHISKIEKECGEVATSMSFRDPYTYTYTYTFTLYNSKNERFYAKRTKDGDTYQFGYHRMVSYRENCYHCAYACFNRVSDITLSDYNGLGKLAPCTFTARKVSGILINTEKGESLINRLIDNGQLVAEERPPREQLLGCALLQHPSPKSWARKEFEKRILAMGGGNFEEVIAPIMKRAIRRERLNKIYRLPRRMARKIIKTFKR